MRNLISFEGIDGAGKSTQIQMLAAKYRSHHQPVVIVREPGGTELGESIRRLLLDSKGKMAIKAELLLFSASRAQLIHDTVFPALENHEVVIMDRFYDSTTAYQGYGRGVDVDMIDRINQFSTDYLEPSVTFYLRLDPEGMMARKRSKDGEAGELDRMEREGIEFFKKVSDGYEMIAKKHPNRFCVLDASEPPDKIHERICGELGRIKSRRPNWP